MTLGRVDPLFRPWLPIELYLPVSEFWPPGESRAPSTEAIQIVDRRWSTLSHELRDALARVGIPYGFYPDDSPDEAGACSPRPAAATASRWCCSAGLVLVDPTDAQLSAALGMRQPGPGGCDVDRRGRAGRPGRGVYIRGLRRPGP